MCGGSFLFTADIHLAIELSTIFVQDMQVMIK